MHFKFFGRKREDDSLEEEIQGHLRMAAEDRVERGETPDQAELRARREMGNLGLIKEATREMWGFTWLERLLDRNYDPALGPLKLRMKRCHARDLRKGLFGPQGSRNVPDTETGGVMEFDLPKGWTLRLTYYAKGEFERRAKAGDVDAEFIPPTMSQWHCIPLRDGERGAEEAHPA